MTTSFRPSTPPPGTGRPDPVRLRVRRPADLLAAVPFLLGFHPTESLVALFLAEGRVRLTARFDLGVANGPDLRQLVHQHAASGLVLVAYCADAEDGRRRLRAEADRLDGVELVDLLVVDGHRWWSLTCTSGCCPDEGSAYAPEEHPLSAEAVWAGLVARPDRAAVVATVAGPPSADLDRLRAQVTVVGAALGAHGRDAPPDALARVVVDLLPRVDPATVDREAQRIDDAACLELALLVQEAGTRDVACGLVTCDDAARHLALWQAVVARTPPELAPAPLCLLGIAAWADGNGTVLNACCERLAALDPGYPMGRLLADVSLRALPPVWWDAMADGLRRDLGLVR